MNCQDPEVFTRTLMFIVGIFFSFFVVRRMASECLQNTEPGFTFIYFLMTMCFCFIGSQPKFDTCITASSILNFFKGLLFVMQESPWGFRPLLQVTFPGIQL